MTSLYQIEQPHPDWATQIYNKFNAQLPAVKFVAVLTAPAALAAAILVGAEVAVAGAVVALGVAAAGAMASDELEEEPKITRLNSSRASVWVDQDGNAIAPSIIYAGHPKRSGILVATKSFQSTVLLDQQRDLIDYIRSVVPIRKLEIRMSYEGESSTEATASGFAAFGGKRAARGTVICSLEYAKCEIIPLERELVWMDRFPTVTAGLRQAERGEAIFRECVQRNSNLSAQVAGRCGFDKLASIGYEFDINVKFGY